MGTESDKGYRAFVSIAPQEQSGQRTIALIDTGATLSVIPESFAAACGQAKSVSGRGTSVIAGIEFSFHIMELKLFLIDGVSVVPVTLRAKVGSKGVRLKTGKEASVPAIIGLHAFLPRGELFVEAAKRRRAREVKCLLRISSELMR